MKKDENTKKIDILIFGHFECKGGIQRILTNLIKEWVNEGYNIGIVSYRNGYLFYPEELKNIVSFFELGKHSKILTTFSLWKFLIKYKPRVVLSTAHLANKIVSYLNYFPGLVTKRFVSIHNNYVKSQRKEKSQHVSKLKKVKRLYKQNDGIIVVSEDIKKNLRQELGLKNVPIHAIWNAAITKNIFELVQESVEHPWLQQDREIPVVINVARLAPQKDLKTLIDAVSIVRQNRKCRLLVLGEGPMRDEITDYARRQGLENDFDLPGFVDNPYAWMARADCFALSSIWEGFGIVLAEALSLGLPVVSTDCPSGPSEILQNGRYGKLVPTRDTKALAEAIERTLSGDVEKFDSMEAVERFTANYSSRRYLEAFGFLENNGNT